jgi:hypothetical protein
VLKRLQARPSWGRFFLMSFSASRSSSGNSMKSLLLPRQLQRLRSMQPTSRSQHAVMVVCEPSG